MIYFPKQKALFIEIPKTGTTSIGQALTDAGVEVREPEMLSIGGRHAPPWMVQEEVKFSFTFVREPFHWYRSWYQYTKPEVESYGKPNHWETGRWHPQRVLEEMDYSSFSSFIWDVYKKQPAYVTRMYEWFCGPDKSQMVDFIGKTENLNKDLQKVCGILGIPELKIPHSNRSRPLEYSESSEDRLVVQQMEICALQRFGYV